MMERMGWRSVSNLHLAFILKMDSGCDDINRDYLMATNDALKKLKKNLQKAGISKKAVYQKK